jgi:hypothetical protein
MCEIDDCTTEAFCKGYCQKHYRRIYRNGTSKARRYAPRGSSPQCSVEECERAHHAKGLCYLHYRRHKLED